MQWTKELMASYRPASCIRSNTTYDWLELRPCGLSSRNLIIRLIRLLLTLCCAFVGVCVVRLISNSSHTFVHTNWTIVAPLFYSLRFSVSLPAYINLQRSCRKASCSSSRESHIISKAVMMNIPTVCLPSRSYYSQFLLSQKMGFSLETVALQFGVVIKRSLS